MELVTEILLHTQFTDVDTILNHVKQQSSSLKNMFINNPVNLLIVRNMANQNACSNYQNYVSGMDYYSFLTQVEQALQTSPDAVLTELESLHQLVLNKTNMITMFTGNESNIGKYEEEVGKLLDTLPAKAIVAQDYTQIPAPARKEGITINTAVQYNMISADYESMGTTYSGKFIPIALVISENYITPRIRFGYGAYDNIVNFSSTSFMMISYRDPNIRKPRSIQGLTRVYKDSGYYAGRTGSIHLESIQHFHAARRRNHRSCQYNEPIFNGQNRRGSAEDIRGNQIHHCLRPEGLSCDV